VRRPAFSEEEALSIMVQEKGKRCDPLLLEVFLRIIPEIRRIREENKDNKW
jgi:response regulator RpfG family c-di-GMP phosphodiesterase